jgi:hypothetical protein
MCVYTIALRLIALRLSGAQAEPQAHGSATAGEPLLDAPERLGPRTCVALHTKEEASAPETVQCRLPALKRVRTVRQQDWMESHASPFRNGAVQAAGAKRVRQQDWMATIMASHASPYSSGRLLESATFEAAAVIKRPPSFKWTPDGISYDASKVLVQVGAGRYEELAELTAETASWPGATTRASYQVVSPQNPDRLFTRL